jgi:LysR family transcriptional regulator, regulator for bpeEF and oprC
MHPSIRAINVFVAVVEAKSFAAAARALLLDPAAVSRAIKALEEQLGIVLFARSTRSLRLTDEGARFHRDCVHILKKLEEATDQFRVSPATLHGRLRVGMGIGLPRRLLMRAVPKFHQQYPQIEIVLVSVDSLTEVRDRGIDLLIRGRGFRQRGGRHPESQGLVVRRLCESPFVTCASPAYLERAEQPRLPTDLIQHQCIAHLSLERDVQVEWQFFKSQARQKVRFVPKLLVHGIDALREAGLAGCGIIRLNAWAVEDELRSGQLIRILPDWECPGAPPMVAIYRKTKPMPRQISVLVSYLTDAFQRFNKTS